jgi:hypothetical protein
MMVATHASSFNIYLVSNGVESRLGRTRKEAHASLDVADTTGSSFFSNGQNTDLPS